MTYQSSGNSNPCPVCFRTKDRDCRFNDEVVLCHSGSQLKPGDCLEIEGKDWALIRTDGGHSGQAAVFKPHRERHKPRPTQSTSASFSSKAQWTDLIQQFYAAFDAAWNVPDFYFSEPQELKDSFAAIEKAHQYSASLAPFLNTIWRDHPDLKQLHQLRIEEAKKIIASMDADARNFQTYELGSPCPAAVHSLEQI